MIIDDGFPDPISSPGGLAGFAACIAAVMALSGWMGSAIAAVDAKKDSTTEQPGKVIVEKEVASCLQTTTIQQFVIRKGKPPILASRINLIGPCK